jgi:hypothetical protein
MPRTIPNARTRLRTNAMQHDAQSDTERTGCDAPRRRIMPTRSLEDETTHAHAPPSSAEETTQTSQVHTRSKNPHEIIFAPHPHHCAQYTLPLAGVHASG